MFSAWLLLGAFACVRWQMQSNSDLSLIIDEQASDYPQPLVETLKFVDANAATLFVFMFFSLVVGWRNGLAMFDSGQRRPRSIQQDLHNSFILFFYWFLGRLEQSGWEDHTVEPSGFLSCLSSDLFFKEILFKTGLPLQCHCVQAPWRKWFRILSFLTKSEGNCCLSHFMLFSWAWRFQARTCSRKKPRRKQGSHVSQQNNRCWSSLSYSNARFTQLTFSC